MNGIPDQQLQKTENPILKIIMNIKCLLKLHEWETNYPKGKHSYGSYHCRVAMIKCKRCGKYGDYNGDEIK
jgi:hypothetical protein